MTMVDKLGMTLLIVSILGGWGWFGYKNNMFKNNPYEYEIKCIHGHQIMIGHSGGIAGPLGKCKTK